MPYQIPLRSKNGVDEQLYQRLVAEELMRSERSPIRVPPRAKYAGWSWKVYKKIVGKQENTSNP